MMGFAHERHSALVASAHRAATTCLQIKELNAEIAEAHPEAVLSEGDLSQLETMLQSAKDKAALADASIALLRKLLAWCVDLGRSFGAVQPHPGLGPGTTHIGRY